MDLKKPAPLASAGFLFDHVLFSVEADHFSELHRLKPKSTLSSLIFCASEHVLFRTSKPNRYI